MREMSHQEVLGKFVDPYKALIFATILDAVEICTGKRYARTEHDRREAHKFINSIHLDNWVSNAEIQIDPDLIREKVNKQYVGESYD